MASTNITNGQPPEMLQDTPNPPKTSPGSQNVSTTKSTSEKDFPASAESRSPKTAKPRQKRPNYNQLHSKPLPLSVHPLPAFHPSNPISLLRLSYIYICHFLSPPQSHPQALYTGLFSPRTRSIHITHPEHVRALWEMGFFGKGTLSRSEPSWVEREKARLKLERDGEDGGGGKAEDATRKRREERRLFKLERARLERERIERQRAIEKGRLEGKEDGEDVGIEGQSVASPESSSLKTPNGHAGNPALHEGSVPDADILQATSPDGKLADSTSGLSASSQQSATGTTSTSCEKNADRNLDRSPDDDDPTENNQEHLQLTLEEAFFLTYSLGVLSVLPPPPSLNPAPFHPGPTPYNTADLLFLSCHHSAFPPVDAGSGIAPDDHFLLSYVAYHHFRSLGWVVRPGVKFGVDHLLYNRGPVFSHAEFGVLVVPAYTHRYWNTPGGRSRRRVRYASEAAGFSTLEEDGGVGGDGAGVGGKDWWWLHCVNRVQSQVRKTLVLCYVDVPSPWEVGLDDEWDQEVDIGRLLRGYKVREFVVRRWVPNRSRD